MGVPSGEESTSKRPEESTSKRPDESTSKRPDESTSKRPEESSSKRPEESTSKRHPEESTSRRAEESSSKRHAEESSSKRPEESTSKRHAEESTKKPDESNKRPEESSSKKPVESSSKKPAESSSKRPRVEAGEWTATGRPRIAFVSRKQRDDLEKNEEKKLKIAEQKKGDELHKRRKEFLMHDEMERERVRQQERIEREKERKRREIERAKERERKLELEKGKEKLAEGSSLAGFNLLKLPDEDRGERQAEKELEVIKKQYLGVRENKKKMLKPSEKFRNIFNFEWAPEEDTQRGDTNPLYTKRLEPQLLFGRGYRAGIDVREQRKTNNFYEELIARRSEAAGEEVANFISKQSASFKQRDIVTKDENPKHWTEKSVTEMNERDWKILREDYQIYIRGGRVPSPMRSWSEGSLSWELLEAINKVGYTKPMPVQMQVIPIAQQCRDLIAVAETGSGKTAAFLLPLLMYLKELPQLNFETAPDGPYSIVMAPTRELVDQIAGEFVKFSHFCPHVRHVTLTGGKNAEEQAFTLRQGVELALATPGRLVDALSKQYTVLHQCSYVILDEADKMIDLGFEDFVHQILIAIPSSNMKSENEDEVLQQELSAKAGHRKFRITQMFSATMPSSVERLARKYLRCPSYISVGDPGAAKKDIEQRIEFISAAQKKNRLEMLLREVDPPIIVFVNQKKAADVLCKSLDNANYKVTAIHGGKSQEQREWALTSFKEGRYDILIATDIAARGIDVDDVTMVINFDMAKSIEDYTHRIGRTGRAGKKGIASTFLTQDDSDVFFDLKNFMQTTKQPIPHELASHPASKFKPGTITENGYAAGGDRQKVVFAK